MESKSVPFIRQGAPANLSEFQKRFYRTLMTLIEPIVADKADKICVNPLHPRLSAFYF